MSPQDRPPPYSETMADASEAKVQKLIVGVDFGTTFTGISWVSTEGAHSKTLDDVHCIRDWPGPGRDGDYSWKTPSRIAYADSDNGRQQNAWGFEVLPKMKSYAWMKLQLDPAEATKYDDPSLADSEGSGVLARPINKSAVDICADYLTEVAKFAYQSLARRISVEVLEATPIEFWFTVPAVWTDRAKADTMRAARKAAVQARLHFHEDTQVSLIREPEAAAVATISYLTQGGSEQQIKVGDSILICDCGGGTVDITTYEISNVMPKLTFKELLVGTGGKCGSTYIDREFIRWMESKFGTAYTDLSWEKRGPASRLMKDFEGAKRDFGKSDDATMYWELTANMRGAVDSQYYDEDDGIVNLYAADLKQMFDPVIKKITALLQSQLDAERRQAGHVSIKTILLVGGFGESAYLNNILRSWCQIRGIRLLCPEHPQSAIVRGAALSGLHNIQPSSRRSRFHYGWTFHEAFDAMRHHPDDGFIWAWNDTHRAGGNMKWELAKGALVDENTKVEFGFTAMVYNDARSSANAELELFCSDEDEPQHYQRDAGVHKLATIRLDFNGVDMRAFPSKTKQRRLIHQVSCKVVVQFGHSRGVLVFTCYVGHKVIGNAEITFDGQSTADIAESLGNMGIGGRGASAPGCGVQ